MAELIHAKFLSWRHLHLLEDPFFAKADIVSAVNTYETRGMPRSRGISNFQAWLNRVSMPFGDLEYYAYNSVKNGDSFYVHRHFDTPKRALLYWQASDDKSDSFYGVNGHWEVHDYVAPALRNKLKVLLTSLEPPKPVVIRQQANPASSPAPDNDRVRDERHMFQLEVESENDAPLPEKFYINLVAFNKTQDTRPVLQVNDVVWDFESRIFRAKPGDSFEVFAITEQMKEVKRDLRENNSLNQSVNDQLITPLEITGSFNRADDVVVHTVRYVVPEVRILVVEQEFGSHLGSPHHEMFVLQHEDSVWVQRIEVSKGASSKQVSILNEGWVRVEFLDIPKTGKFSLISIAMDQQSSPIVHFNGKTYDELMETAVIDDLVTEQSDVTPLAVDDDVAAMDEYDNWLDNWNP
jgi:hypothetical protein